MTHEHAIAGLRRALVVTVGEAAAAVAGQTLALGRTWLGVEPPLALVSLPVAALNDPTGAETRGALTDALDRLADARLAAQLQQAGALLTRTSEITVWLVIQADDAPGGSAEIPPALTLPATLAELAWERLRAQAPIHALLLAEPAREAPGAAWAAALAAAGVEGIGLVSPVSADRLRWATADWQANAAVSLALWLWSDVVLDATVAERTPADVGGDGAAGGHAGWGEPVAVWAVGAAAWRAPRAEIRAALIPRCAYVAAERLLGGDLTPPAIPNVTEHPERNSRFWLCSRRIRPGYQRFGRLRLRSGPKTAGTPLTRSVPPLISTFGIAGLGDDDAGLPPWELSGLAVTPERHRLSVAAAVPPQPTPLTWGRRQPAWSALAPLPEALRQQAAAQARQAQEAQFNPRGAWLTEQVAAWAAALDQLAAARLACADGWGALPGLQAELQAKMAQLRAACALIEDWLEEAGGRFARAEDDVARAERELTELCASFPAAGRAGALTLLVHPWRWPALAWAYLARLPQAGQRYLDACSRRGEARWAEANLHALRQAYLAMAQIVQERQRALAAWSADLQAARAVLALTLAELPPSPAPWDAPRLDALAQALAAGAGPGWGWAAGEAVNCEQALLAWAGERTALVDGWTAADWLARALGDEALADWLGDLADRATPLWPGATPEAAAVTWLACGGGAERLTAALRSWLDPTGRLRIQRPASASTVVAAGAGELRGGTCQADVVAVARAVKVSLAGDGC